MTESEREAFTHCWQQNVDRLHAYAVRQVGRDDAPEIVSEAFLQAWRRWSDVPDPALPWLIGTARRLAANQRRGHRRRDALTDRMTLVNEAAATAEAAEMVATQRQAAHGVGLLAVDSESPAGPILFGHAAGGFVLPAGTVEVRITGPGFERTVPVTGAEGWATVLPIRRVAVPTSWSSATSPDESCTPRGRTSMPARCRMTRRVGSSFCRLGAQLLPTRRATSADSARNFCRLGGGVSRRRPGPRRTPRG